MTWRFVGMDVCAYGHLSWITPCLTFLATIFFMLGAFRCSLTVQKINGGSVEVWSGYWSVESFELASALGAEDDSNVCVKYADSNSFDGVWKFGKSLSIIGVFTMVPTALLNLLLITNRFQVRWFNSIICMHLVNSMMALLLILARISDYCKQRNCVLARAGYVAIMGSIFWFIAAYLHHLIKKIEMEMEADINGIDSKDEKPRLALPAPSDESNDNEDYGEVPPEGELLALPAPGDDNEDEEAPLPRKAKATKKSTTIGVKKKKTKPTSPPPTNAGPKKKSGNKKKKQEAVNKADDMA